MTNTPTIGVLAEVAAERAQQDAKWGEQNHPDADPVILARLKDGGPYGSPEAVARRLAEHYEIPTAARARFICENEKPPTWMGIAVEELGEVLEAIVYAIVEQNPAKLRAEWIQVAAVACKAVEVIDQRTQATALGSDGAPVAAASDPETDGGRADGR